jgi:hypothetical protein
MATSTLGSGTLVLAGTTSGTTTVTATAVAGTTTLTLPAATDTLVGKATTDTLTNKTLTTPTISSLSSASATALTLQSAGTTAITVDTSQNVCIGTGSVLTSGKISLQADLSTANAMTIRDSGTTYGVSSYYTLYQNSAGGTVGGIGHTAVTSLGINAITDLQFSTANTERARFNATGALVFAGGTTTANGIGITFPATQSASTNANTLDDYEEGTWTPTFISTTGTNPTVTYSNQYGYYVKVGRMVHINIYLTATAITGGTGWLTVGGLPFNTDSSTASYSGVAVTGVDNIPMAGGETQYGLRVNPGGSTMLFVLLKANTSSGIVDLTGVSQGGLTAGGTYISV